MITHLELRRQLLHILLGTVLMIGYLFDILVPWAFGALMLVLVVIIMLSETGDPLARSVMHNYDRKHPVLTGWGAFTFLKGFLIASVLFDKTIALAALAIMVYGDGVSTLIGTYFGKRRLRFNTDKSIEGSIAGLIAAFLGALIFVPWFAALPAALVGMFIEAIKKPHRIFDDNFLIPIIAGTVILIVLSLSNGFI